MGSEPVTVEKITIEKNMIYEDEPVLHYKIDYPQFRHPVYQNELNKINEWYLNHARDLQKNFETELYPEAVELYEDSNENHFPFHMYDAVTEYKIAYNQNNLLSLYYDNYIYSGGAHGNTIRGSDTWNIKTGCRIPLYQFTNDPGVFLKHIFSNIEEQIASQTEKGENMYFDDYQKLMMQYFNPESYYLTPNGLVIYYQQYEIAPYASGIPEFVIRS